MVKDAINTSDKKRNALTEIDSNAETSSSDEKWSDGESYDSGDTENIPHHSTTKKKRSEFNMCCCSLFFIFQISPTSSFIGKKQRKAASARVSESPTVELPPIVELPATALVSSGELVQGHPKDDSVYLASDDSDAPRRTMRIRKTTSRYGLESQEGSDEDANSMEQDEESESEHGSDEDAYSMDQEDESDSEPKGEPEGCFAEEVEEEEFEMDKEEEEWKLKHDPLAKKDGDFDSVSINQEDKDDVNQWQMVVFGQDFDSKPQRNVHGKNRPKPPSSHSIT